MFAESISNRGGGDEAEKETMQVCAAAQARQAVPQSAIEAPNQERTEENHQVVEGFMNDQPDLFDLYRCAECNELIHREEVIIKQFYNHRMVIVEYFCSDKCHHQFYIKRLNQLGM